MQRKERILDGGGGGDTYAQGLPNIRGASKKSVTLASHGSDLISHGPRPPKTPAPLLGSPSEFMREALQRGLTRQISHTTSRSDRPRNDGNQLEKSSTFPPIQLERQATSSGKMPASAQCTSCSDFNPADNSVIQELGKQCRRENRNPTLYRIASPLEISRIPEHLRNLKTIPLEQPDEDVEEDPPPEPPPPYYPPGPLAKKHGKVNRKQEVYWRWEKPDTSKRFEPPSACRILEEVRRQGSRPPVSEAPPPSVVDVEENDSESEAEVEVEPEFSLDTEAPTHKPQNVMPIPPPHCVPKSTQKQEIIKAYEYNIFRGPKLLLKTKNSEIILHQEQKKSDSIFVEAFDDFSATSKCMETRKITMLNEGTTVIRFQWIRARPGPCIQKFLGNAPKLLEFGKNDRNKRFPIAIEAAADPKHQKRCGEISSGPRKLALHLTTSRKVNPALTRTIKMFKNTVSADSAFDNLLLLLSLRVPRLKRELIRRTQRQLSSRTLPHRIQQVYLQLRKQRRVKFHDRSHAHRRSRRLISKGGLDWGPGAIKECTCILPSDSDSDSFQSDESVNFFLFPEKVPHECICTRPSSPPPPTTAEIDWETGDILVELPSEDGIPYFQPQLECVCEGICICEPPSEGQGLCVCGPYCICSPQGSWGAFKQWAQGEQEGEDSGQVCKCIGTCSCADGNGAPVGSYPATPPPSGRKESLSVCQCQGPCECDLKLECTSECLDLCGGQEPWKETCDPQPQDAICKCVDPCSCDLPEECVCGITCPCITPPFSPSCSQDQLQDEIQDQRNLDQVNRICVCKPCTCDPSPEDFCPCGPNCLCITPPLSELCLPGPLPPEECTCQACKCGDFEDCLYLKEVRSQLPYYYCGAGDGFPIEVPGEVGTLLCEDEVPPKNSAHSLNESMASHIKLFYQGHLSSTCLGEDAGEGAICPPPVEPVPPKPPKIRKTRKVEFIKPNCQEFIFCELPLILLPGQKLKFEIMFRPREPGIYSETIYLLTHPRLNSNTYAVRLRGICVNPENPPEICKAKNQDHADVHEPCIETSTITKSLYSKMYQRQGTQALKAIMDHVIHFQKKQKPTFPFGRLTTEAIFKAHNHQLHYYPDTSETALHLVKTLVQLLVRKTNITGNPELCQRNITKLYYELLKSPKEQEYFRDNLMSNEVEQLLVDLNSCTSKLIQPRIFKGVTADERCETGTEVAIHAMIDELLSAFGKIEDMARNPYRTWIWRKVIRGKLEGVREYEIESIMQDRRQKREARKNASKLDISTQTDSKDALNDFPGASTTDDDDEVEENLHETTPQVAHQDIEFQLQQMNKESIYESRLSTAQDIIAKSIQRMLSLMDATENLCDYEKQQVITSPQDEDFNCCI